MFYNLLNVLQCRALHKQLNHNSALRSKLAQDLQVATDAIQQLQVCLGATSLTVDDDDHLRYSSTCLQDQLATTSSNYEKQLSTMSDHLCEMNDKLLKQNDEIEDLKRSSKVNSFDLFTLCCEVD